MTMTMTMMNEKHFQQQNTPATRGCVFFAKVIFIQQQQQQQQCSTTALCSSTSSARTTTADFCDHDHHQLCPKY